MANEKRVNCSMRHENGNCLPCGGFCTAVNDSICEALHNAFRHGQSEQYERLALSIMKENAKHEQEKLEELRKIYKKVTSPTVEVVHGQWFVIEDDYFDLVELKCSVCGESWGFEDYEDCIPQNYHYCPNCGAKMDGDWNGT